MGGSQPAETVAFTSFYDAALPEVYRYVHRATAGDRQLTEDVTQEAFLAAVRAYQDGNPAATTMPWIIAVARHKLVDHYRRKDREARKLSLAWSDSQAGDEPGVSWDVSSAEALALLEELPPLQRLALLLRYVDDLPVSEVARQLDRSVHATESLLVRARQGLERLHRESLDG